MMTTLRETRRLFAAAILILGAGCGDRDGAGRAGGADGPPESGGTVVIAEAADMNMPIPLVGLSNLDISLGGDVMYMELLRSAWEDGRLVFKDASESPMAIARSYEFVGPDSTSIRYHMRSDLRWSDGEPITADDVVFTYTIIADPALGSPVQHYGDMLEEVVAENDSTVLFRWSRRHPEMITNSAAMIIPEHIFGDTPLADFRNHPLVQNPENGLPVSGPYMIGSWERGQRIVFVRNPHFQPAGHLDQIVFRIIPDPTTRLVELQTGAVDVLPAITLDQVAGLRAQAPHVRLEREEKRFYDYIGYNPAGFEPFGDVEIRRAMGLALDTEGMVAAMEMDEWAVPAGGPYPPIFRDLYDPTTQAALPHDTATALSILAGKGWRDSDGDGVLDRNGQPFRFTLTTNAGNQRRADAAQIAQQQWKQIGIEAEIEIVEFNQLQEMLQAGDFQAVLGGWGVGLSPSLVDLWGAESPFNFTRYQNPALTRLLEQAVAQPTPEAANPIWKQVASQIVQDRPYTWLYFLDAVDGVNNRVRGTKIDTYGTYQNVWEWWIPAAERRAGETLAQ